METTPRPLFVDPTLSPEAWAAATFGACELGDARLTARVVALAGGIARSPERPLSASLRSPAGVKGAYRFVQQEEATIAAITAPHRAHTLAAAGRTDGPVLLVQDTSTFDYSHHPKTTGLGPIGDGRGQGFLVHSVLAIQPGETAAAATVLGLAHVEAFDRIPAPRRGETSAQRRTRERESACWLRATAAVGTPPVGSRWVLVGDRGADIYGLFVAAREVGQDLLVRVAQDRRADDEAGLPSGVRRRARALRALGPTRVIAVPAAGTRTTRAAQIGVSWTTLLLHPPARSQAQPVLPVVLVRAWEVDPPDGETPVDWMLITTVPTSTLEEVWERVEWYRHRWIVEEYHQALKTGCRMESAQLRTQSRLWALLGVCAPIAVRLLQLRMVARADPQAPAIEVLDPETVAVVAALTQTEAVGMTAGACWRLIARLGGHLGRQHDGPPGWRTIWAGMSYVQTVRSGVQLAATLHPP